MKILNCEPKAVFQEHRELLLRRKQIMSKMSSLSLIFYSVYLLTNLVILGAHGVNIQLYKHENFTGLVSQSSSNEGCINIPKDKQTYGRSIRTDTCFIAYAHPNCQSWVTDKYLPGDIILTAYQLGWFVRTISLQTCNEEEGGNQLNLDITEYLWNDNGVPAVLDSYKNVCSCVNVPQSVQNLSRWSIDNHHNDLLAYYEPDCSVNKWKPEFIPAGHNWDSRGMHRYENTDPVTNTTYKIQSFGPDPNSTYFQTSCNSSHVVVAATKTIEGTTERGMYINDAGKLDGFPNLFQITLLGFHLLIFTHRGIQWSLFIILFQAYSDLENISV